MDKAKRRAKLEIARKKKYKTSDKYDKPSLGSKAILALLRAKKKLAGAPKGGKSKRTQRISSRLKAAGLTKEQIDRLRGKKKA
jgi:hypothetical protein